VDESLPADVETLVAHNRGRGLTIDAQTTRCKWTGERMDYGMAVGYLIEVRNQTRAAAPS
jgi:hypothetical protein